LAYRRAIEEREDGERVFAVRWARDRLTVFDGDSETIVALLGGDLSAPHQFIPLYEAKKAQADVGTRTRDPLLTIGEPGRSRIARDSAIFGSFIGVLPPLVVGQRRTIADKDYMIVLASLR
jgi:hypothetical protein